MPTDSHVITALVNKGSCNFLNQSYTVQSDCRISFRFVKPMRSFYLISINLADQDDGGSNRSSAINLDSVWSPLNSYKSISLNV